MNCFEFLMEVLVLPTKYWVGPADPAEARLSSSPSCRLHRFEVILSNCRSFDLPEGDPGVSPPCFLGSWLPAKNH